MFGFGQLIGILKKNPKKIVFTEGEDPRILEASSRLLASYFLHPILIGDEKRIADAAEESGFNIRGAEIIDPEKFDKIDEMVELYCELRKKKGVTPDQAREVLKQANYFGTMLVKMGFADALLGGAVQPGHIDGGAALAAQAGLDGIHAAHALDIGAVHSGDVVADLNACLLGGGFIVDLDDLGIAGLIHSQLHANIRVQYQALPN